MVISLPSNAICLTPLYPFFNLIFTFLYCIVLSSLSSIHKKVNCIPIFWTGHLHSFGSCHFRSDWATCLPHKNGGVTLSALLKDTSKLASLFSTTSLNAKRQAGKLRISFFKVLWYDSIRENEPQVYRLQSRRFNHYTITLIFIVHLLF